ncbi:unnamed protein product, partial [Larinioides sclopetarius]
MHIFGPNTGIVCSPLSRFEISSAVSRQRDTMDTDTNKEA